MSSGVTQAIHLLKQENIQLKERLQAAEDENKALQSYLKGISALHKATLHIVKHDNLLKLLDEILYQALVVLNADYGSLLLVDEEREELVFVLVHGDLREKLEGYRIHWHKGIAGAAVKHREPLVINHVRYDPRFSAEIDERFGTQSHKILAVPMIANNRVIGVLELINKRDGSDFTSSDVTIISLLALFAAISLEQLDRKMERAETAS